MSTISFGGLATGLDTGAIITQLVELKRAPIYRLESRKQGYQNQISKLGTLKSKLLALQNAADELRTVSDFSSLKSSSSDDDVLGASASSDAAPGVFDITVTTLAKAQREMSQGFDSLADSVGQGTISFTVDGETTNLSLVGYTSLESLASEINDNVQGVSAAIINDGSATGAYRLVVRGSEAGSAGAFTMDMSGLTGGISPVMTNQQAAVDASITVDGVPVTATSNNPDDVISGITLNLKEEGQSATVTIERDTEGIADKVKALVDAYNDLFGYVNDQTGADGALRSNASARSVASRVENIFSTSLSGGLGDITLLAQVGVTRGDSRQLEFDEDDFLEALGDDFGSVRDLFVERDGNLGMMYLVDEAIEDMTDSYEGLFKLSTDSLNSRIDSADSSIERYERSIESYQTTLERQYAAMEQMVAQLNAQGSYLSSVMY